MKNIFYNFKFFDRKSYRKSYEEEKESSHGEVIYNTRTENLPGLRLTSSAWDGYLNKYGHDGWQNDVELSKRMYHFKIDYPLTKDVYFNVELHTRNQIVETIIRAYHQLYTILEVDDNIIGQWGHALTDLDLGTVKIYEDGYVEFNVNS